MIVSYQIDGDHVSNKYMNDYYLDLDINNVQATFDTTMRIAIYTYLPMTNVNNKVKQK